MGPEVKQRGLVKDTGHIVVDCVRAWPAPFDPSSVVAEAAELLKAYGIREVVGDRYGAEWPVEAFRKFGVTYKVAEKNGSELYLELLPTVNSGTIELLDNKELLRELRGLERRRGRSGKDSVDHRPGSHDDLANACAGVAAELKKQRGHGVYTWDVMTGERLS